MQACQAREHVSMPNTEAHKHASTQSIQVRQAHEHASMQTRKVFIYFLFVIKIYFLLTFLLLYSIK